MSQLPEGWVEKTFDEIGEYTDFVANGSFASLKENVTQTDKEDYAILLRLKDHSKGFKGPFKYVTKPSYEFLKKSELQAGDLFLANVGAPGRTFLVPELDKPMTIAPNGIRVRANDLTSNRFIDYFIRSRQGQDLILSITGGNAQQKFNKTALKKSEFPLPPLEEQKRIADKLDSVLAKVEAAQARLDNIPTILKRFRQSALASATSGELTKDWRLENDVNSWESTKVGNLLDNGPQNGIYKPSTFYGSGTKIIRIDGFYDGQLVDWNTIKRVNLEENELEKWKLKPDDILINRVNSIEYLGKCGHVKKLPEDAVFESNIMRISLKSDVLPEYLTYFLSSPIGLQRLRDNAKHAVNQASINQSDVKSVIFEKPSISEQKIIISKLSELLGHAVMIEKQYKAAKVRLDKLTQSILAKAFRGELLGTTVQQVESELKQSMIEPVLR